MDEHRIDDMEIREKNVLAIDQAGNKLLEFIDISEETAPLNYSPITVCLLVVK